MKLEEEDQEKVEAAAKNELFDNDMQGRVLIAEDDDSSALMLETFVRKNGLDVVVASNGKEALNIFRENMNFDLVFMDLKMPHMNGFDAAREIRKISADSLKRGLQQKPDSIEPGFCCSETEN
ncbi:MAG: response regulator [Bacteroidota bacterium]|nr:response regulator [Bacteroidota bacterium]